MRGSFHRHPGDWLATGKTQVTSYRVGIHLLRGLRGQVFGDPYMTYKDNADNAVNLDDSASPGS